MSRLSAHEALRVRVIRPLFRARARRVLARAAVVTRLLPPHRSRGAALRDSTVSQRVSDASTSEARHLTSPDSTVRARPVSTASSAAAASTVVESTSPAASPAASPASPAAARAIRHASRSTRAARARARASTLGRFGVERRRGMTPAVRRTDTSHRAHDRARARAPVRDVRARTHWTCGGVEARADGGARVAGGRRRDVQRDAR